LKKEIEEIECGLIFGLGNSIREALTGIKTGIRGVSGTTELIKFDHGMVKVVWCVHPSAVLRGDELNIEAFEKGLLSFVDALRRSDGKFNEILF
jgi:uracil-DNA glycosylase